MNNQKRNVTAVNISVVKYSFTVGALCQMPLERSGADDFSPPPTKRLPHVFFHLVFVYSVLAHTKKALLSIQVRSPGLIRTQNFQDLVFDL